MKAKFKVIRKLKNIEKRVNAVKNMYDISFLTGKISKDMEKEVDMRFRNEVDPEGKPWKGLKIRSITSKYNSGLKKKSKFSNKYSQRIASIKEADEKMKRKAELEKNKKEKASSKTAAKKAVKTEKRIVKEETKYEKIKENIDRNNRVSKTQKNDVNKEKIEFERPKREIKSSDKTRNEKARKKTPQEIREEMLRKLDESKLK